MPVDPMPESLVARRPAEESTAATSGLGGGERLADGSTMVLAKTAGSSGAEARAADAAPVFGEEGPAVLVEQTALPKASKGMVGHAIQGLSP